MIRGRFVCTDDQISKVLPGVHPETFDQIVIDFLPTFPGAFNPEEVWFLKNEANDNMLLFEDFNRTYGVFVDSSGVATDYGFLSDIVSEMLYERIHDPKTVDEGRSFLVWQTRLESSQLPKVSIRDGLKAALYAESSIKVQMKFNPATGMWETIEQAKEAARGNEDPTKPIGGCMYTNPQRIGHSAKIPSPHSYQATRQQQFEDAANRLYKTALRTMREIPLCPCTGTRVELTYEVINSTVHLVLRCNECGGN